MSKFEVGDLVKGLPESNYRYSITYEKSLQRLRDETMQIRLSDLGMMV